jgi:hypothetical protein
MIHKIPDDKQDIYSTAIDPVFKIGPCYPKCSYGFQHYLHQSKGNMEAVVEQFKDKQEVYQVINKFEATIDNYDNDLNHMAKKYFDTKSTKSETMHNAFYIIWELYMMFRLVQTDKPDFISAHLVEDPDSFVQATTMFRDKFCKKGVSKNDRSISKDIKDLTSMKTIRLSAQDFKKSKAHLVTADSGSLWENKNMQEQEAFSLILGETVLALNILEKGGSYVVKIYETFTDVTVKFYCVLKSFFKEMYVTKPLASRRSDSEKYLVCTGYNGYNEKKIGALEKLLEEIVAKKDSMQLNDIFPEFTVPHEVVLSIVVSNTDMANKQFQSINEIITFINSQNYRGDEYQKRRNMQIDATKYWVDTFFPDAKDYSSQKKVTERFTDDIISKNDKIVERLMQRIKD